MKKSGKSRKTKKAAGGGLSKNKPELPDLVTIMARLVERLENLEKKMDSVSSRVLALPLEFRQALQSSLHSESHRFAVTQGPNSQRNLQLNHEKRERIIYKAVCADCCKACEVPFKPSEGRPVYCPECFAIRKAGHRPKDIASKIVVPEHLRQHGTVSAREIQSVAAPKIIALAKKKTTPAKKSRKKKK